MDGELDVDHGPFKSYVCKDLSQVSLTGRQKRWLGVQIISGIATLEVLQERYRISRTKLLSYRRGVLVGTRFSSKRGRAPTFDDDDENEILRLVLESGKEISSISDEDLRFFAEKVHIEGNLSRE